MSGSEHSSVQSLEELERLRARLAELEQGVAEPMRLEEDALEERMRLATLIREVSVALISEHFFAGELATVCSSSCRPSQWRVCPNLDAQYLTNTAIGDPRVNDQEWARREAWLPLLAIPCWLRGNLWE